MNSQSLPSIWPDIRSRQRVLCSVAWLLTAWIFLPGLAQADWKDDIGFTQLESILGSSTPNGAGVPISLVEANSGGTAQNPKYFPNVADSNFAAGSDPLGEAVNFIDGSGGQANGVSGHSTGRALEFFGNTTSIAPAANEVTVYDADSYLDDVLKVSTNSDPLTQDFRVQNFSWIGSYGAGFTTSDPTNVKALQRFDHVIDTDEITALVGLNNGTGGVPYLLGHSYNALAIGRTNGSHSRGGTLSPASDGYGPGRTKPSLVAPLGTTSAATSVVSSAATLLHSAVAGTNASKSETMRAILMAGATKDEFDTFIDPISSLLDPWDNTPTQPLDSIFGAGELNVFNSWLITDGSNYAGTTSPPISAVGSHGWDYQTVDPGDDVEYLFEIPAGKTAQELSIILTWNYEVKDNNSSSAIFNPEVSLANLDLTLVDDEGMVDQSISTVDNVEHLYLTDLGPGSYTLKVSTDSSRDFGIAWRTSTLFDTPSADFDEGGYVDGGDFLAWQRGFGTLINATHAMGDADGDGDVDADDLSFFNSGYGTTASLVSLAVGVPEPGTWLLAAVGMLLFFFLRRQRQRRQLAYARR